MKTGELRKEEVAEDFCFICKDGGTLLICEYRDCLKAYHPQCVGKDESFLGTGEHWNCSWHSCFICRKRSNLQCFCCPSSVCRQCVRHAEFVQLRRKKGFCTNCLRLVLLIEENADVDSDGCQVDFKDTETYEFLFKDYWEIVKEQEKLGLKDLHEADIRLKKGENYISGSESDQSFEEEGQLTFDSDATNINFSGNTPFLGAKGLKHTKKGSLKGCRSKKRHFRGWGSIELIEFLISLGEDTKEPLKQWDINKIIENYIQENNLLQPNKKKKTVLCDERLRSLFRKRTVKFNKIYNLLEDHFASNEDSDDESLFGSEEDFDLVVGKRFQQTNSGTVQRKKTKNDSVPLKGYNASMIDQNIKLVYLRRSLIKEFLGTPETFKKKVMGCFVRVKRDPKDFDYSSNKAYQLGLVSDVKKVQNVYMVGEVSTDIVLSVSNSWKDVYIFMLSDDDFEEEECEDLRQSVKRGLFKRPTVEELDEKVRSIHEDIMSHWIKREIAILQRQIDRANEKGWKREKCEYIERRAILQTDAEQTRLLKQIPEVIPDVEEVADMPKSQLNFREESKKSASCEEAVETNAEGKKAASCSSEEAVEKNAEGKGAATCEKVGNVEEADKHNSTDMKKGCEETVVIKIDGDDEPPEVANHSKISDIDAAEGLVLENTSDISDSLEETHKPVCEHKQAWYYVDPAGKEQGPFTMASLRYWKHEGFFDEDFSVWRAGQSQADAISLAEALLLTES
uniref:Uncharacterized protein At5g08430 n=1 Tax=Anthurium amnicola TaxID=1678845 RepID=A0A1D1XWT8_9ARAE